MAVTDANLDHILEQQLKTQCAARNNCIVNISVNSRNYENFSASSFSSKSIYSEKKSLNLLNFDNIQSVLKEKPQLHKQFSSGQISQKSGCKRRLSFSGYSGFKQHLRKRKRVYSVVLPTKFLLGGNIKDPLNLKSLEDEEISQKLNAFTPVSSPIPVPLQRAQVQVLIPPNIHDPLNLNGGEDIQFHLISPKSRKRKRHRKSFKDKDEITKVEEVLQTTSITEVQEPNLEESNVLAESNNIVAIDPTAKDSAVEEDLICNEKLKINFGDKLLEDKLRTDKIVSPVVPQGSVKFYRRHSKVSVKAVDSEKAVCPIKAVKKPELPKKRDSVFDSREKEVDKRCCFGSFPNVYICGEDPRLKFLKKEYFSGMKVLDLGCNNGCISSYIAEHFEPKIVTGVDIDHNLINIAYNHLQRHFNFSVSQKEKFPVSMNLSYGPISRFSDFVMDQQSVNFPHNVNFLQGDYVLKSNEQIQEQREEYDVILCLRLTKWIHLNYGDEGVKRSFKRMFAQLKSGGKLILEAQSFSSYKRKKSLSRHVHDTYMNINFKPEDFLGYLLTEVGFSSCKVIGRYFRSQEMKATIYLLLKESSFNSNGSMQMTPLVFQPGWFDPENCTCSDWRNNSIPRHGFPNSGCRRK